MILIHNNYNTMYTKYLQFSIYGTLSTSLRYPIHWTTVPYFYIVNSMQFDVTFFKEYFFCVNLFKISFLILINLLPALRLCLLFHHLLIHRKYF